ncbi:MAG TPA: DinB family protein [Dehalococcoidia bacterium]|nr:DinB family protein [Dehalococcoidia bacterium]
MEKIYQDLKTIVDNFYQKYEDLSDEITSKSPGNNEWNLKEIIGHLIDSACHNHQRFVRLRIIDELVFPDYGQDNSRWIQIAGYNQMKFQDILSLWRQYNLVIANIIKGVDSSKLDNYWLLNGERITLKFLMTDYLRHIGDHLNQFEKTLKEVSGGP